MSTKKNQKENRKDYKKKIDFKYNLNFYWNMLKEHIWIFIALLFLVFLKESFKVVDKYIFKLFIDGGTEFAFGTLLRADFMNTLIFLAIAFIVLLLLKAVIRWLFIHFINLLDGKLILDLKKKFFNHIVHLSHNFHTTHKTGSLISRLIRGGGSMERMTDVIVFSFAPLLIQVVLATGTLLYFDLLSATVVLVAVVIFIAYGYYINNYQQWSRIKLNEVEDFEKANVSDVYTNIDSIKHFGKESNIKARYAKLAENSKKYMMKQWNYFRWLDAGQGIITEFALLLLLYFPLMKFLDGGMTIGSLVFIYTIYGNLMYPLYSFVHGIRNYYRSMADFQSLFQYAKIENEIKDLPNAKKLVIKNPSIEFKNITFQYDTRKILRNFSLKIPKNKKIALVGSSGSGKSTIVKLLYRLYDLQTGEILIDGKNITNFKQESLRSELSIVPQECVLFDDTIYNNIQFSNPTATRKQVLEAIKFAQLDKIINLFPRKENTVVGERGVKLSGGEKQRVSIARAILADKKILVLDEATSSLDSETEHEIQKDLEKLMKDRTSIIIAHRLSTIMTADIIVVIEKGKITQMGTHNDLIKLKKGIYKKLWEIQKGGYI